jgi:hypothetical protein
MGAHIHAWEGGEKLDVFLNENPLTTFIPKKVSSDPEVWRTLPYIQSVDLKQGDVLTSTATYSNPYDVPITGAMGMTAFFIHYDE